MKILVEKDGPITTIILNRPERRNAVDDETAALLKQAFTEFDADGEQSVAVFCGTDGTFCAGYDLKSLSEGSLENLYEPEGDGAMGPSRMFLSKPVICAVEGCAVAGGLELSLLCDMRIASETAQFGVFCRRWGVPLVDGGTVRLPRLIGMSRALDMILTGRAVDAQEALEFGLANRVVSAGQARVEAEKIARDIAQFPQLCMKADRASAYKQWDLDLPEALINEGREGLVPIKQEARAGATRFASGKGRGGDFSNI